jgi:hypothetical protein
MEMRFNLDSCTTLVISDSTIADPRPNCAHGCRGPNEVAVQLAHTPLGVVLPDFVQNISLRSSEARTIASALMTAAQSVR